MRRQCRNCGHEYMDTGKDSGATARVDGRFYMACSGFCLVEQIAGRFPRTEPADTVMVDVSE